MIKNHWYGIIEATRIKAGEALPLKRFGLDLLLWRNSKGKLSCFVNRCPHRQTALSLGKVKEDRIECAFHGYQYDTTGQCVHLPADGQCAQISKQLKVQSFPLKEVNDIVWMWWGDQRDELPEIPWFESLEGEEGHYVETSGQFPISFSRTMEANMDFAHFHYVHKFFKVPGNGPRAREFDVKVKDNLIEFSGEFGPEDLSEKGAVFEASILFPGLALYEAPGVSKKKSLMMVASAPLEENKTWFLVRIYVIPGKFRAIRKLYWKHFFFKVIFPILQKQDIAFLKHQNHTTSGIQGDILCSKADRAIAQYLQLWRKSEEQNEREMISLKQQEAASHRKVFEEPPLSH